MLHAIIFSGFYRNIDKFRSSIVSKYVVNKTIQKNGSTSYTKYYFEEIKKHAKVSNILNYHIDRAEFFLPNKKMRNNVSS